MEQKSQDISESSRFSLTEALQRLKAYNPLQYFTEGALIDANDNNGSWRVARIMQIKSEIAELSFDGWSSKWNEMHKLNSGRLMPFRKFTPPYTGPLKNTNRSIDLKEFVVLVKKNIHHMDQVSSVGFLMDSHQLTQSIRGEIFIMIDVILHYSFPNEASEHLKLFVEFLERFIKFFTEYLTVLPSFIKDYVDGKAMNTMLYLVHEKIAAASCFPEMFSSIVKIFGAEVRCLKFYQQNEFTMNSFTKAFVTKPKDRHSSSHTQIVNFVNMFGNLGGFDRLLDLMKWEYVPENKKPNENDPENVYKFPFLMIKHILLVIDPIINMMSSSFKDSFLNDFKRLFFLRIDNISVKEIKDLDPSIAFGLLSQIQTILDEICVKETFQLTEEAELNLSLKLLKSPFLQKKIRGITHFKECIERTDTNSSDFRNSEPKKKMKYFNTESLRKYFVNSALLDIILGENFHVEVFKRSQPILKFFATSGGFTPEQLSALWKAVETKHEGYTTTIYELFNELVKSLSLESLEVLFTKIISTPQEKCDEALINLMMEFSLTGMQNLNSSSSLPGYSTFLSSNKNKKTLQNPKNEFFALKYLWDLAQDSSKLDMKHIDQCLSALHTLLKSSYFKSEKEKYINLCFENVKQGVSVPQSLDIALHVLSTYNTYAMFSRESLEDVLNKYNKEYNLNELIIAECEEYLKQVAKIQELNKQKGVKLENIGQNILIGKYNHHDQIMLRLSFLQTIDPYVDKKYSITLEQIKRLWVIMVKKAVTPVEESIFLNWLTKPKEGTSKRAYNFSDPMLKSIFLSIISDKVLMEDYATISVEIYSCIQSLFEIVNINEELLENTGKSVKKVIKYDGLFGMEYFWSILIKSTNEQVQKLCRNFLINMHLKFGNNVSTEQRLKIWQSFMNKCLDLLNNVTAVPLIISLVKGFFENIQGTKFLPQKEPGTVMNTVVPVQIKSVGDEVLQKRNITLPSNATFLTLRLQINEEFNLKNIDFEFVMGANNTIRFSPENEEEYPVSAIENLKEKVVTAQIIKGLTRDTFQAKDKFKLQMANNPKFTDTLLELLSNTNVTLVEGVWQILTSLPLNKNLKSQIEKLTNIDGSEENWNKLLDYSCYRKFMYCLEIIDDILDSDNSDEWSKKFCKKEGFHHLFRIFEQITDDKIRNSFNLKCFGLLAKILRIFLSKNSSLLSSLNLSNIVTKSLFLIFEALNFIVLSPSSSNTKDQTQDENYEENEAYMPEEFMDNNLHLILFCYAKNRSLISILYKFKDLSQLLRLALLECNDIKIRTIFQNGLLSFLDEPNSKKPSGGSPEIIQTSNDPPPHLFFLNRLITDYKENPDFLCYRGKCNNYFDLIYNIFHKIQKEDLKDTIKHLNLFELQSFLISELFRIPTFEQVQTDNDYYLQGLLKLFDCLIYTNPEFRNQLLQHSSFMAYLYDTCLFEKPTGLEPSNTILPPKCKSSDSRKAAFGLLGLLITEEHSHPKVIEIVEKMRNLLGSAYWRTNAMADWNISSVYMEKSMTGYVGLKNLGCTCYMNSLLQQFFMIPEFREAILSVPSPKNQTVDDADNLLYQFQLILAALKNSHKQYYDPRGFCYANKDYEGKPVNVLEQMDVDEFFNSFLDKLEGQIKHSRNPDIIKKIFGGILSNELICKGCPHYSEREEMFLALGLQVKNKKSIAEGLDGFIQGEMLEGENAYFCDKCDKKVPTLKRTCIKKLPNMLIMVLKRFEFDYDKMIKIKLNDFCEFPQKINMMQYTQAYLKKKEKEKNNDDLDSDDISQTPPEEDLPNEYYEYTLKGVVIHLGTADSGHYYSLISDGDNTEKWLEFNDIHVKKFDLADLASEAFGGDEKNITNSMMNTLSKSMKEKSKNAYLLFYERSRKYDENGQEVSQLAVNEPKDTDAFPRFFQDIKEDNVKYYINRNCFDSEFSSFIMKLLLKNIENNRFSDPVAMQVFKFGFLYFFAVVVRFKDREKLIPVLVKTLKKALNSNVELACWFLNHASCEETIRETLIECPLRDIKYIISGLYLEAVKKLMDEKREPSIRMLDMCLYLLAECKERKIMDVFYRLFIAYSKGSKAYKQYLFERKAIGLLHYYIMDLQIPSELAVAKPQGNVDNFCEIGGLVKARNPVNIKSIEEIVEKKKEKSYLENVSVNYSNLIIAFSNLVCSILLTEPTTVSNKSKAFTTLVEPIVDYKPDKDEAKMILFPNFWRKLWFEANTKNCWKPLARFFCHICLNNKQVTLEVLKIGLDDLNICDDNLKVYLKMFESLMLLEDEMKASRVKYIAEKLVQIMRDNIKCYKFANTLLESFFKMCGKSSLILKTFSEVLSDKPTMRAIEDWIKSLKDLGYHLNSDNSKFIKKLQEKLSKLNKIYKEDREGLVLEYDSDEDYLEIPPRVNDKLDVMLDNGTVLSGVVSDTFEDMFCLKQGNISRWMPYDSEKVGPYGKMHDYYEDVIEFFK